MKKKIVILSIICLSFNILYAQTAFKSTLLDIKKLPKEITFDGKCKKAIRWTDKLGDNIVILSETGEKPSANPDNGRDAELFAYRYLLQGSLVQQAWKMYDFEKECQVDLEASFFADSPHITDLDHDGIAELWLQYKTVCHGDVSPCTMKLIVYQSTTKYAMRGHNKVQLSEKEFDGGDYTFDKAFTNAPKVFRDYALSLWNKNILQKWE